MSMKIYCWAKNLKIEYKASNTVTIAVEKVLKIHRYTFFFKHLNFKVRILTKCIKFKM